MIEANGLTRIFDGLTAVDHLDLGVSRGSVFGFLGRNGAGKTTTLKMLSTVMRPTSGSARIKGFDVVHEPLKVRAIIGVIGEGVETTRPFWTPVEYLRYFLGLHGLPRREADLQARQWLERLDLAAHSRRPIGDFSSGMRKRLELCRALAPRPEVLLLDEPTKELDIPGKREIWELLQALAKGEGYTVFLCSHEVAEIEAVCEDIAIIRAGRLWYRGSLEAFPDNVLKITGTTDRLVQALEARFKVVSHSMAGQSLYLAHEEKVSPGEVREILEATKLPFDDIREVHSLDERMMAFL